MNVEFRKVQDNDFSQWCELYLDYSAGWGENITKDRLNEEWELVTKNNSIICLVGVNDNDVPVSFATVITSPCTYSRRLTGYIQDLYVSLDYRCQSIGKNMVRHIHKMANDNGWYELTWKTRPDNLSAQKMYDKMASQSDWIYYVLPCNMEVSA